MYTLFIDTHDELITVALYNGSEVLKKEQISEYSHAVYFSSMVKSILCENNIFVKNIKNIVVVNGPGSFTGLRIGLSFAKTMAYSLSIPIYVVSSLSSYLVSSDYDGEKLAVIEDNKGFYISVFDKYNNVLVQEKYVEDLSDYEKYYKVANSINVEKIINYALSRESVDVHLVKANYVKKIEVEK